jgi:S1-C subfamily serine protease
MDLQRWVLRPLLWTTALAIAGWQSGCTLQKAPPVDSPSSSETPSIPISSSTGGMALPPNFVVQVVQKVGPAVVRINSARTVQDRRGTSLFENFFDIPSQNRGQERVERGTGSGFIFDAKGLVMTNAHVVDKADAVTVLLKDGRELKGKVLGEDPFTDIAVVKIEATKLPVVNLGDSKKLLPENGRSPLVILWG